MSSSSTSAPPAVVSIEHEYSYSSSHSTSVGPVIGVVAVIAILGVVAGLIGRLCTGRKVVVMGHYYQYDVEGWVETKFASCIDGSTFTPPSPPSPCMDLEFTRPPHDQSTD